MYFQLLDIAVFGNMSPSSDPEFSVHGGGLRSVYARSCIPSCVKYFLGWICRTMRVLQR